MPHPDQENQFRPDRYRDSEAQLGGADDVEKTTYVTTHGTDPNARKGAGPVATVPSRGAGTWVTLVIVALVVLVALLALGAIAYLMGVAR